MVPFVRAGVGDGADRVRESPLPNQRSPHASCAPSPVATGEYNLLRRRCATVTYGLSEPLSGAYVAAGMDVQRGGGAGGRWGVRGDLGGERCPRRRGGRSGAGMGAAQPRVGGGGVWPRRGGGRGGASPGGGGAAAGGSRGAFAAGDRGVAADDRAVLVVWSGVWHWDQSLGDGAKTSIWMVQHDPLQLDGTHRSN